MHRSVSASSTLAELSWTPAFTLNWRSLTYCKPLILHMRMCEPTLEKRVNTRPQLAINADHQRLLCVFIDTVEGAIDPAISSAIVNEIV